MPTMPINRIITGSAVSVLLAVAGCAHVSTDALLKDTQELVSERGVTGVYWRKGEAEDAQVDAAITELLSKELTLDGAVQIALLNNRNLQATYEGLQIAQADLVQAGLLGNPVFGGSIRFAPHAGPEFDLGLMQNFIDLLVIPLRQRMADAAVEVTKLQVAGEVMTVAAAVKSGFISLQAAEQTLEMRQQVVRALGASFELTRRLRQAGNVRDLDLASERAAYEQAKLDVRLAEVAIVTLREEMNELLGLWGKQTDWRIANRLPELPPQEVPLKGLENEAVAGNLELAAMREEIYRRAAAFGLARPSIFLPSVSTGVEASRELEGDWLVGPSFSFPIPLINQGQPAIKAAEAELRQANERLFAGAVALRARVRATYAAVSADRDRAEFLRRVVIPLRQQVRSEMLLQYNAMQIGVTPVLLAKQAEIDAGLQYIEALRDYWLVKTDLDLLLKGRMRPSNGTKADSGMGRIAKISEGVAIHD